ncbi:MAG TPA: CRISPR-associated endonuclease Cas1 [Verrucomicrobiae bacterium]|nr:CRISPR-associated endonuclease Cas1 [Verrucomicrobiae bacterium]
MIACPDLDLDPGPGILHADTLGRACFACDLMDAVRPLHVGGLCDTLDLRHLTRRDWVERYDGEVRCRAGLPPRALVRLPPLASRHGRDRRGLRRPARSDHQP